MVRGRLLTTLGVAAALSLAGLGVAACSGDDAAEQDDPSSSLQMPTTTTTTTEVGVVAPTSTFLPNTPVIAGQEAILTGTYSQNAPHEGAAMEDVCHYVTIDDGAKTSIAFSDTYLYDGVAYPGPADYVGDPEQYPTDPLLVHPGDRIAVRGEVVEAPDDPCATPTAQPGLTVLVSTFAPS